MSITDELRKYANRFKNSHDAWSGIGDDLTAIADRIDVEHERRMVERADRYSELRAKMNNCYVELPKDADGVPIHAGDVLDGYGKTIEVVELRYGRSGWVLISRDGNGYADTFAFAHHKPTVEDVLREFANEVYADADNEIRDRDFLCAKYAKRLTLAEGEGA